MIENTREEHLQQFLYKIGHIIHTYSCAISQIIYKNKLLCGGVSANKITNFVTKQLLQERMQPQYIYMILIKKIRSTVKKIEKEKLYGLTPLFVD